MSRRTQRLARRQPVAYPSAGTGTGASGASMASHSGAAGNDLAMLDWNPLAASADADLLPDLGTLTARSRDLARNNGLMAGGQQTLRDNIVGAVLRLAATPDYRMLGWTREYAREWGNNVEAHFRSWAETTECDAGRSLTLLGLTLQALGGAMTNGDAVALPLWLPRPGLRWNTRLMVVESDRLCTPLPLEHREDIRGGVEMDAYGAPVAYHVLKRHPGDRIGLFGAGAGMALEWERIPAFTTWGRARVLHLHDKERSGQSRGKPIVSAVMREFRMAGKYAENELQASLANSLVAAFLESDLDQESAATLFGQDPRASWAQSVGQARNIRQLKGAAVIPLPAGAKMSSFTPGRPNQAFDAFMVNVERRIAAGMNMPYELLMKDFSRTNYSSARAALLEAWRYFHGRRRWLSDYWLRSIYELWLEEAVNSGAIDAPGFYANRYAYCRARFIFGGRGWVDPVKEAQASALRMEKGISTLEMECAEQGLDYEEVLDQQQLEARMRAERGLPPLSPIQIVPERPARADDETDDEDEDEGQTA
ncbi:phage portal protein [uncultured Xylophilus sp.]|uniref:phage portal protein n=1 Tax=uncultured Xylophilus sp. TaxID=296832 RepID=UPI0025E5BBE4|nr:phage portal protein [uncultured Xylophilus sp.]